jgi:hypothetical protein
MQRTLYRMGNEVFLPSGESLGVVELAEDGAHLLIGHDGLVLAGANADGVPLDERELRDRYETYAYRVPPVEEQAISLQRRLDLADAQEMATDPSPEFEDTEADGWDHAPAAFDLAQQLDHAAARAKRPPFTRTEQERILGRAQQDLEAGRRPDVQQILSDLEAEGDPVADFQTRNGRLEYAGQKLADAGREERNQQLGEADPSEIEAWIAEKTAGPPADHDDHDEEEDER